MACSMLEDFDQAAGVSLFQSVACFRVLIWEQAIGCLVYSMLEHFDKRAVDMMLHHQNNVCRWGKQFDLTLASPTKVSAGSSKAG